MRRSPYALQSASTFAYVAFGIFAIASAKRLRVTPSAIDSHRPNTGSLKTSKASLESTLSFEALSLLAERYVRAVSPINGRCFPMLRQQARMADAATIERSGR